MVEHWAVVGGGILGMTLAHRLRQHGHEVTLYEAGTTLGGLAGAWDHGGVVWDRHYHVTLLSDSYLRTLLAELGLEDSIEWVTTRTGFFTDGRLVSLSNSLEFLRFPFLGLIDKLRLGATLFYASKVKDWRRLEQIPVVDWLLWWSGRRTVEKIWLPLLRAKLGENYRHASAAFIWAIIARMYAARRTGLKKEMFGYVPGGYNRILARFADVLLSEGVVLKLGQPVALVDPAGGQVMVEGRSGERALFDRVVLTLPCPAINRVCPGLTDAEQARLRAIRYQGIVCASLLLKEPLAGYYVTNITESWVPFTAVIEMSALVDRRHFGGRALVYLPRYADPADPVFELSDDDLKERFLAALRRMYPHFRSEDVLGFRVSRVRHVLAITTLNYSESVPPMPTTMPGVYIVNSAQIVNGTLNVNETIRLAENAARALTCQEVKGPTIPIGAVP
jgi:protoporphyrinogen oxidase